jgi:hypothetical protein
MGDLIDHLDAERLDDAKASAQTLKDFIENGIQATRVWRELNENLETRRRLTESEQRRLVAMNQAITIENAMALVAQLAGIVRKYVSDRSTLDKIAVELTEITGKRADPMPRRRSSTGDEALSLFPPEGRLTDPIVLEMPEAIEVEDLDGHETL